MKKYLKKISQNAVSGFDFSGKCGILCVIGIGTPVSIAEAAAVKGGDLQKFYGDSLYFESAGRTSLCGVTIDTCSNPAGSFFVPDLELREKSREKLVDRRLELCKSILQTVNRTLFSPIFTATTPPGVCPITPQFRSTTPEPIL